MKNIMSSFHSMINGFIFRFGFVRISISIFGKRKKNTAFSIAFMEFHYLANLILCDCKRKINFKLINKTHQSIGNRTVVMNPFDALWNYIIMFIIVNPRILCDFYMVEREKTTMLIT